MDYTLTATNITDSGFTITITTDVSTTTKTLELSVSNQGASIYLESVTDPGMPQGSYILERQITGLTGSTEYTVTFQLGGMDMADPITVTTKATGYDTPRTATQEQWEDLADRVNVRPIISSSIVPPISVEFVGTNNIANGAVTPTKIDMASLIDVLYPVGCYFETSDTTFDPNVSWGGTWVEDSAGKVTVSQDTNDTDFETVGSTGGSKELQEHIHTAGTYDGFVIKNDSVTSGGGVNAITINSASTVSSTRIRTNSAGTGNSGNLQPYIVVKRWHRTA